MKTLAGFSRPSPASLALVGLLGLLLWGQCAFHLSENGSSKPAPNLHLKTAVRMVRLDSLSTRGPDRLYLTLTLRNQSREALQVLNVTGLLTLDKKSLGFNLHPVGRGVVMPGGAERVFSLVMQPYQADEIHKGSTFDLLRAPGQAGQRARRQTQVLIYYSYYPYPGTPEQANGRSQKVPLVR
jgi:hypothetical protein